MAVFDGNLGFKMWGIPTAYGTITYAESDGIIIEIGGNAFVYSGSFSYDAWGNVYGTMTGYAEYSGGALLLEVSGFGVSASFAQDAVETGNIDTLFAVIGSGNDKVYGSNYADRLAGFNGNDNLFGNGGNDIINGNAGADTLNGGSGHDDLYGGSGNDYLVGGTGSDYLNGGSGYDMVSYVDASYGVRADLQNSGNNAGFAAGDVFVSIENLDGSKYSDTLLGNGGSNAVYGWNGNDKIVGRGGNDFLYGEAGHDRLEGGAGADKLYGGGGNDKLIGGGGKDKLVGGNGKDKLVGGNGSDKMTGGGGNDTFVFNKSSGKDTVTDFGDGDTIQIVSGANRMRDLDFTDTKAGLLVEYGEVDIFLNGLDRGDVNSSDFDFG